MSGPNAPLSPDQTGGSPEQTTGVQIVPRTQHHRRMGRRLWWLTALVLLVAGLIWTGRPFLADWALVNVRAAQTARNLDRAKIWLDRAGWLGAAPQEIAFLRARQARKNGQAVPMEQALRQALAQGLDPRRADRERVLMQAQAGNLLQAEPHLGPLLLEAKGDEVEICEAFVNAYVLNYRVQEADQLLDSWSTDFPRDPLPELFRGRISEHKQELDLAEQHYRRALELDPRFGPAAYNLARLALSRQQIEMANTQYRSAAELLPYPAPAWIGLAHCARLQQQPDRAEEWLLKVLQLNADEVAEGFRQVGDTLESARTSARAELAQLRMSQSRWAEAAQEFERALEGNPRNNALRNLYAQALRNSGRRDEARREIARVQTAQAELNQMTSWLEKVRKDPQDPAPRVKLGLIFLHYLSENQGLVWLYGALSVAPDYGPAHQALADYFRDRQPQDDDTRRLATHHQQLADQALASQPMPKSEPLDRAH